MSGHDYHRLGAFLQMLQNLPSDDHRFLKQLIVELARRDQESDTASAEDWILEVTREIAPDRVEWVRRRFAL